MPKSQVREIGEHRADAQPRYEGPLRRAETVTDEQKPLKTERALTLADMMRSVGVAGVRAELALRAARIIRHHEHSKSWRRHLRRLKAAHRRGRG